MCDCDNICPGCKGPKSNNFCLTNSILVNECLEKRLAYMNYDLRKKLLTEVSNQIPLEDYRP